MEAAVEMEPFAIVPDAVEGATFVLGCLAFTPAAYWLYRDLKSDARPGNVSIDWIVAGTLGLAITGVGIGLAWRYDIGFLDLEGGSLAGAVILLAGATFITRAVGNLRGYWQFGRAAGPDVVHAEPGRVAVGGTVEPVDDPLAGPFSGDDVVAYETRITERSEVERSGLDLIHEEVRTVPFVLSDETARIRVDPADASLSLDDDVRATIEPDDDIPESVAGYLSDRDLDRVPEEPSLPFPMSEPGPMYRHYVERNLKVGDDAVVVGRARGTADGLTVDGGAPLVVAEGTFAVVTDSVRRSVVYGGVGGFLLAVIGTGWLLVT